MRILLVEDIPDLAEALQMTLEARGHSVRWAANGALGLRAFKDDGPFDAVLTDYNMPMMNGFALIREIRKLDDKIAVALMSGDSNLVTPEGIPFLRKGWREYDGIAKALGLPETQPQTLEIREMKS